ncbi:hypothetical protein HPB51_013428 [Rhipicephalus microplus]|uniref:Tick transposon n=1 Tax=Rhipicephalus microplus TaxID=6941 RepID=A0A9J6D5W9_RHIMP|nr:hypothetical protein HPB51_013428 [Rhipicephalus microplus]
MGRRALGYAALVPHPPSCGLILIPPHQDRGLEIKTTIPGVRSKKHTPQSDLHQETVATTEERLAGRVLLYTDGSVTADGSAAATCFAPSLGLREKFRLPISASCNASELAAVDLAANQLVDFLPQSTAVVCDSRAALLTLARGERGGPVAQRLVRKFAVIVRNGCNVLFHDVAHLRIARHACASHPDSRVATGNPPQPLPRTGISRRARAFLLRLRTGCSRTTTRRFHFTNSGSPSCAECPTEETTEHILLQCPGYTEQRWRLFDAYGRLGLPHVSLDHLRFPQAHRSRLMRAFEALLEIFGDAALLSSLASSAACIHVSVFVYGSVHAHLL